MTEQEIKKVREHSIYNFTEVVASTVCGCFYCLRKFPPSDIVDWADKGKKIKKPGRTALCPHCGIDSVIGDRSNYDLSDKFLKELYEYSFSRAISAKDIKAGRTDEKYWKKI